MARSKSSERWLREHFADPFVKKAQKEGYRSRAVYKLMAIEKKYKLFKSGMTIVELGAAPGSWTQIIAPQVQPHGKVIAIDLLPMEPLPGVLFLQGDFTDEALYASLEKELTGAVDVILSDMAPNLSGQKSVDQPRMMALLELVGDFALKHSRLGGSLLCKLFLGPGIEEWVAVMRKHFTSVHYCKPEASRGRSPEIYLLARGFKGQ